MPTDESSTPWMKVALAQLGLHPQALKGTTHNDPLIMSYLKSVGYGATDDVAWCGAFVNWCLIQAGYSALGAKQHGAGARNWIKYGTPVLKSSPRYGAIAVFSRGRPGSGQGHVAFYTGCNATQILVLGGNQGGGRVTQSHQPRSRLLGYRWPVL